MTDRDILELAARAAGFRVHGWIGEKFYVINPPNPAEHYDPFPWAPLDDDGDALRLAVKLDLLRDPEVSAFAQCSDDPYAATRRAIVRAAAEIARSQAQ